MEVITYLSTMMDLFCKCKNRIPEYFKEGRKFWTFHQGWKLITITYKRSNHIFYTIEGDKKEYCIPCDCMMALGLVPETIYISELPYKPSDEKFRFDDYEGAIKINVIE